MAVSIDANFRFKLIMNFRYELAVSPRTVFVKGATIWPSSSVPLYMTVRETFYFIKFKVAVMGLKHLEQMLEQNELKSLRNKQQDV